MSLTQEELFNKKSAGSDEKKSVALPRIFRRPQHSLQEVLLKESLVGVQLALGASDINELREKLVAALPQNSQGTRRRYVDLIMRWFFRDGARGFATTVWERFQNDEIQTAIHRYLYLAAEPIIGTCVASALCRLSEGVVVPGDYLAGATAKLVGHELNTQTKKRLLSNLRKLGFLERSGAGDRVVSPVLNKTALLIALHHAFNVDHQRSIEFATLAANPFWRFIGLRSEDSLRDFLKEAVHAGYLGKYVVADRLEQVTTCLTLSELLERRVKF
jgi:hypothetical protein